MNEIKKNRLDLAYQRQLHLLNFILIIGAGSIISLIIGLILNIEKWFNYSIAFVIISIITFTVYSKVDSNLKGISHKIEELS